MKINKVLENRISMYKVVLYLCMKNTAILALFVAINEAFTKFKTLVGELDSLVKQKLLITLGLTEDKKATKKMLASLTYRIEGALHSFALNENNNEMMEQVKYTESYLEHCRDTVMIDICKNVYDLAIANTANIEGYGVDANMLITFNEAIGLFENKSPQPTSAREHGATLTLEIEKKDKEISGFLKKSLDRVIVILEPNHPTFVKDYQNSRKIIDLTGRKGKKDELPEELAYMEGTISDADGKPMADVPIELKGGTETYTTVTDEEGNFLLEGIVSGKYLLTLLFFGMKTITEEMVINTNDEIVREFVMEKDETVIS